MFPVRFTSRREPGSERPRSSTRSILTLGTPSEEERPLLCSVRRTLDGSLQVRVAELIARAFADWPYPNIFQDFRK